jgi:hypothetical protein
VHKAELVAVRPDGLAFRSSAGDHIVPSLRKNVKSHARTKARSASARSLGEIVPTSLFVI